MSISALFTIALRLRPAALILTLGLLSSSALAAESGSLRSPSGGEVRALVIGIDAYRNVRPLRGAAADARDIEGALRGSGVQDITALIDDQVSRDAVMAAIEGLTARSAPHDLVILTLAGHGAQEPERVKGSHPDGLEDVFLLPGFEASPTGSQERIFGAEFNHLIKQIEQRGARGRSTRRGVELPTGPELPAVGRPAQAHRHHLGRDAHRARLRTHRLY